MTTPPNAPGIAPTPESKAAFIGLHEASPEDLAIANCYFLGEGITIITNRDRENPDSDLAVILIDEATGECSSNADIVCVNVGEVAIAAQTTSPRWLPEAYFPTSILRGVAEAVSSIKPVDRAHLISHTEARSASLSTPSIEGVDINPIRALISTLTQKSA